MVRPIDSAVFCVFEYVFAAADVCAAGWYLKDNACVSVPAGYYKPPQSVNEVYYVCPANSYSVGGASACSACGPVSSSGAGSSVCVSWPSTQPSSQPSRQPSSQPSQQPSSHVWCAEGTYVSGGACVLTPAG